MSNNLITLYGKRYTKKVGPYTEHGTEFYKDEEMTELFCRNPYRALRKSQVVTIDGWRFFVKMK